MNRIEEIRTTITGRSKAILNYTTDLVEWSANKNLAVAGDVVDFAVTQMRLPVEAEDFLGYRDTLKESYSDIGSVLNGHREDAVAKLRSLPAEVREIIAPAPKPAPVKKAAKPAAKATAKPAAKAAAKPKAKAAA